MKSLIAILLSCLSLSASAEHLFVTPEDVIFSGTVTAVSDGDALLAGSVSVGDSVSGFYELVRPDKNDLRFEEVKGTGSALVEEVDYGSRCGDLQVSVGGTFELGAGGVDVTITDFAAGDGSDLYTARATGRAARAAPDLPFDVQAELLLQDASGEAAEPKQALPRPGDLANWDAATLTIVGCAFGSGICPDSAPRFEVEASINTLTAARSDTCLVTNLETFTGEGRFQKMKDLLVTETTPVTVDSALIRSDLSLRLQIDPTTELLGQADRVTLGTSQTKSRFEIAPESEPALLDYIEAQLMAVGSPLVPDALDKPATVQWRRPYRDLESTLKLDASFLFQDGDKTRKGVFRFDVTQPEAGP